MSGRKIKKTMKPEELTSEFPLLLFSQRISRFYVYNTYQKLKLYN